MTPARICYFGYWYAAPPHALSMYSLVSVIQNLGAQPR